MTEFCVGCSGEYEYIIFQTFVGQNQSESHIDKQGMFQLGQHELLKVFLFVFSQLNP